MRLQIQSYCEEGARCRHAFLMGYFGEASTFPGGRCPLGCDNCERVQHAGHGGEPALLTGFDWSEWATDQASAAPRPLRLQSPGACGSIAF